MVKKTALLGLYIKIQIKNKNVILPSLAVQVAMEFEITCLNYI